MAAKMDKEADGSAFVRLQVAITDPVAIEKVLDKRYLTGSVGGRAGKAICSISGEDLAVESSDGRPKLPKFRRGQVYKGRLAFVDMQDISFKEYSFVNQPADSKSSVRSKKVVDGNFSTQDSTDDWVAKSSAFVLSMDEEDIYSVKESRSLLQGMKPKESKPLYLHLKGSFLTAMAVQESENYKYNESSLLSDEDIKDNTESQEKEKMENVENQEDILAVAEELSNSLSSIASESADDADSVAPQEQEDVVEDAETNAADSAEEISNDNSEKADEQAEEAVDSEEAEKPEEKPEESQAETSEGSIDEKSLDGDAKAATESDNSEILARVKSLEEENAKLKKALHRTLVERVVDAKISVGIESVDNRDKAIEEHADRTASSLADSLRDLARIPKAKHVVGNMPEITSETEVVEGEQNVFTVDNDVEEVKADPKQAMEQLFVDTLMGRRKL